VGPVSEPPVAVRNRQGGTRRPALNTAVLVAAELWAVAVLALVMVAPLYSHEEVVAGVVLRSTSTLVDVNGAAAVALALVPLLATTGVTVLLLAHVNRGARWARPLAGALAVVVLAIALISLASVGVALVPVGVLLVVAVASVR
jgi:hypothetical protein